VAHVQTLLLEAQEEADSARKEADYAKFELNQKENEILTLRGEMC